jgi:hypothetical protein
MAVANTLAYYVTAAISAVKSFRVQAPGEKRTSLLLKIAKCTKKYYNIGL